jgi:hypothetical protein
MNEDLLRQLVMQLTAQSIMQQNQQYAQPGPYSTMLMPSQEVMFRNWLQAGDVPFNPNLTGAQDYDMRGFWQAMQQGDPRATSAVSPFDQQMHYPDYWKTPYHQTFSADSQWARPGAPSWLGGQLMDRRGNVLFDERR